MPKSALINSIRILFCMFTISTKTFAAPEGKTLDLGIYKLTVDLDNGLVVRREIGIDLPFLKMKKTNEFSLGTQSEAGGDDSDESEEMKKRRKKREITSKVAESAMLVRKKRDPCFGYMPGTGGTGGTAGTGGTDTGDMADQVKRRKRKVSRKSKPKKNTKNGRRRRRREAPKIEAIGQEMGLQSDQNKLGETFDKMIQKVNHFWKGVLRSTEQLMHEVKQAFNGLKTSNGTGNTDMFVTPKDAEYINL